LGKVIKAHQGCAAPLAWRIAPSGMVDIETRAWTAAAWIIEGDTFTRE
jgi:hypothetical protein